MRYLRDLGSISILIYFYSEVRHNLLITPVRQLSEVGQKYSFFPK